MRVKNKEIRQRRHRKEDKIKDAARELRLKYGAEKKPAAPVEKAAVKPKAPAAKKPAAPKPSEAKPKAAPKAKKTEDAE